MIWNEKNVYRHEDKYIISKAESIYLTKLLDKILYADSYGQCGSYWIRSLYFDTIDDRDYSDHLLGICRRKKIRLRIYDTETNHVKVEIKNKEGEYTIKESALVEKQEAMRIINGDIDFLISKDSQTLHKVWRYMKAEAYYPRLLVDYNRKAYQYKIGNVRITFDSDIRIGKSIQMFENNTQLFEIFPKGKIIMELKYSSHLPSEISNILSTADINQQISNSKYCFGREMMY